MNELPVVQIEYCDMGIQIVDRALNFCEREIKLKTVKNFFSKFLEKLRVHLRLKLRRTNRGGDVKYFFKDYSPKTKVVVLVS